jgi:hypothetical protein
VIPFIFKDGSHVAIAGAAAVDMKVPALQEIFGNSIRIRVLSAAQPFGGSIRSFGLMGGDEVEQTAASEEGGKYLYHPSLISFRGIEGAAYANDPE